MRSKYVVNWGPFVYIAQGQFFWVILEQNSATCLVIILWRVKRMTITWKQKINSSFCQFPVQKSNSYVIQKHVHFEVSSFISIGYNEFWRLCSASMLEVTHVILIWRKSFCRRPENNLIVCSLNTWHKINLFL